MAAERIDPVTVDCSKISEHKTNPKTAEDFLPATSTCTSFVLIVRADALTRWQRPAVRRLDTQNMRTAMGVPCRHLWTPSITVIPSI